MFGICDTVEKLFAQAMAGSVFSAMQDDDPKGTGKKTKGRSSAAKVLSVTLGGGGGGRKRIAVAEEDQEDFDSVVEAVAEMGWWSRGEQGEIVGSGTLEVRAFV